MKSMIAVIKEQFSSLYLIFRLSAFELKSANTNNYLGRLWELINPMIQLGIYWFIFGIGIRKGQEVTMQNGVHVPFYLDGYRDDPLVFCKSGYFQFI